jgi:hypothetical protein
MSVQTDFIALASAIFAGRLYPAGSEEAPVPPYATFFRVAAVEGATLDLNGGTGNEINTRLQVDVWALSYLEAQAKADAVKVALKGWEVENVLLGEQDMFEEDTKLHRVMLDISTWHM